MNRVSAPPAADGSQVPAATPIAAPAIGTITATSADPARTVPAGHAGVSVSSSRPRQSAPARPPAGTSVSSATVRRAGRTGSAAAASRAPCR
ncbi:hypothetical protein Acy02nite_55650 [Actinoplanes cyaneus]|uniref:Uncharacterized protein n=1 Tax=Actinoplanes cyaneus TaxID=52696 RepID=A0A919M9M4_9ACTN|nr:hypothetical protein [Actinoplanes cyaneus]GID67684.1 hypothetical protein Acy02nite_55650 [Actinoplanes cyaneus]